MLSMDGTDPTTSVSTDEPKAAKQDDLNVSLMSTGSKSGTTKSRRPRMKGLLKNLQKQVEFYFGDANLPKDKFLQQKMSESPGNFVPVKVIASFKKMRSLTDNVALILKAIQNSTLVELSEDSLGVRRATPLPEIATSDVDSRTVYVENLPPAATNHDSIKKMFKIFGEVLYVSLPRHRTTGDIKGFAFIEFASKEEADSALMYFKDKESKKVSSEKSVTVTTSQVDNEQEVAPEISSEATPTQRKRKRDENDQENSDTQEPPSSKKFKPDSDNSDSKNADSTQSDQNSSNAQVDDVANKSLSNISEKNPQTKECSQAKSDLHKEEGSDKSKIGEGDCVTGGTESGRANIEHVGDGGSISKSRKRKRESDSQTSDIDGMTSEGGVVEGKKKRKKNRQHKTKPSSSALKQLDLRVLAKTEWMSMKEMYKDVQKQHMKQLKEENKSQPKQTKEIRSKGFVSQCLVKVECQGEYVANVEEIQVICSAFGNVAYIDLNDGDKEGYVRYGTSGCVSRLLEAESSSHPNITFSDVKDEEERAYFLKTQAERKQRYLKTNKRTHKRGQDKLISKVLRRHEQRDGVANQSHGRETDKPATSKVKVKASHIKFSDSDSEDVEQ